MDAAAYVASNPVAFSHDNARLAVAAIGEAAQIFDLETGHRLYRQLEPAIAWVQYHRS